MTTRNIPPAELPIPPAPPFARRGPSPTAKACEPKTSDTPSRCVINLTFVMARAGYTQSGMGRLLGVSQASVSLIINQNHWPKGRDREELKARIAELLRAKGITEDAIATAFDPHPVNEATGSACANTHCPLAAFAAFSGPQASHAAEDESMLLRKYRLTPEARAHFKVPRDPFPDHLEGADDVFVTPDIRYVRATMRQTAKHGGFLAVTGESGAGKSTLALDLQEWINTAGEPITIVSPFVLGMGRTDRKSRTLVADDIIRRLGRTLAPGESVPQNIDARAEKVLRLLTESARIGRRHVLLIEEAHDLATPTLKYLKRFYELRDGFRQLLSIILVAQPELLKRLTEHDPNVREVVQRLEIVQLPPLDESVGDYLRHKFRRADADFDAIFDPSAVDAIRAQLRRSQQTVRAGQRRSEDASLCHPLAIQNLVAKAMNEAVLISAPRVDADLINEAARAE